MFHLLFCKRVWPLLCTRYYRNSGMSAWPSYRIGKKSNNLLVLPVWVLHLYLVCWIKAWTPRRLLPPCKYLQAKILYTYLYARCTCLNPLLITIQVTDAARRSQQWLLIINKFLFFNLNKIKMMPRKSFVLLRVITHELFGIFISRPVEARESLWLDGGGIITHWS